jgi:hypothetical protein
MKSCINMRILYKYFLMSMILIMILFLSCEMPYQVDVSVWISKAGNTVNVEVNLWDGYGNNKVGNAVVLINGTTMPKAGSDANGATYREPFGFSINDGDLINLIITGGDIDVDQTFIMPHQADAPSLVNPSPIDASQPQPVNWTPVIPGPPQIIVRVWYNEPGEPFGYGFDYVLSGDKSSFTIPAGFLPNGTTGRVEVYSCSSGSVNGKNVNSDSIFEILNRSSTVASFTTQ